jgi:hypothetical protein
MSTIRLEMEPMSRLTNLRIWLASYLVPKGWAVSPQPTIDPAKVSKQIDHMRETFTCSCLCHRLSDGLGMSHAVACCGWPGRKRVG